MRLLFTALLAAALAMGCSAGSETEKFRLTDVTGAGFGKSLDLTDHHGNPRTLADFRGKVVAIFFGFTHCPDVCPTALVELAQAAKALGPDAGRFQVLFVTVDPERDTREVLARYVPSFDPSFLGLYGDAEATARAAKEFKVYYRKQPSQSKEYSVDHSAGIFILDGHGRLRLFAQYGQGGPDLVHDIRLLLKQS